MVLSLERLLHVSFVLLKPKCLPRHLHLWWAFRAACEMINPNCMEWSGHLLLVLIFSLPRIFMFSAQIRAQKTNSPLLGGQPTTLSLALLPLSLHSPSCFPGWWW